MDYCGPVRNDAEYEQICDLIGKVYVRNSYFDLSGRMKNIAENDPYFTYDYSRITSSDDKVTSHVAIRERELCYGTARITMGGIADVATNPANRGQGLSRILMEDSIEFMENLGLHISILYGIPRYYHKFGYIESIPKFNLQVPVHEGLLATPSLKTRPAEKKDLQAMARLYESNYTDMNLSVIRPRKYWNMSFRIGKAIVAVDKNNRVRGYAIPLPGGEPGVLSWKEVAFSGDEAAWTLIHTCSKVAADNHAGQVAWQISPEAAFTDYVMELGGTIQRHDNRQSTGGGMIRILNLKSLFEAISPELERRVNNSLLAGKSFKLAFKTDIGALRLLVNKGNVKVGPVKAGASDIVIKIPQIYLARLIFGYRSVPQVLRSPGVAIPKAGRDILNTLFPKGNPYISPVDYF
jgi:predicted acetyltransferase